MRRRGIDQPLLQRGVRHSVCRDGSGQLPVKRDAPVRFLTEPVFERRLTRRGGTSSAGCQRADRRPQPPPLSAPG